MRIAFVCLILAGSLAGCNSQPGPSETRGLPIVQTPYPPGGGAGGVIPIERPPGSRGGDKGS